ncbi:MAG TPA: hypothetical protein VHP37_11300 [Burkholderiales bacterium]|nr:hypothetical protein [Burkholderiales bacterium]
MPPLLRLVSTTSFALLLAGCVTPYTPKPGAALANITFVNKGYTSVDMHYEACGVFEPSMLLASLHPGASATQRVTANEPFSFSFIARVGEDWSCSLGFLTFTPVPEGRYEIEFSQTGSGPPARCSVKVSKLEASGARVPQPTTDCRRRP